MAEGEEDFSSLPLPDRFTHKVSSAEHNLSLQGYNADI
jgi:hypothetical protein